MGVTSFAGDLALVTNAVKDIADNCFQYINTAEVCAHRRFCPTAELARQRARHDDQPRSQDILRWYYISASENNQRCETERTRTATLQPAQR